MGWNGYNPWGGKVINYGEDPDCSDNEQEDITSKPEDEEPDYDPGEDPDFTSRDIIEKSRQDMFQFSCIIS